MLNPLRARVVTRLSARQYATASSSQIPRVPLWIDNKPVDSGRSVTIHHAHGHAKCELVTADTNETETAIKSSKEAFQKWRKAPAYERRRILNTAAKLLPLYFPKFTKALQADAMFIDALLGADRATAINVTEGAAALAIGIDGWVPPTVDGGLAMVLREPYGPTLSIPAFNYPLTLALRSIVYPLACGNTVIFKSSIHVPQAHALLGPLFAEAGLPAGVLQILNFSEDEVATNVSHLIAHDDVRMVNFTGSTKLGRHLAAQCGQHLKPSVMELGGKSAAIVLPGADLTLAANNILFAGFFHSGQVCMSTERAIVHSDVYEEFSSILASQLESIREKQFEQIRHGAAIHLKQIVSETLGSGVASLLIPSVITSNPVSALPQKTTPEFKANSTPPLVIVDADDLPIAREETFAPIVILQRAESTAAAIEMANSHETGLTSSVFGPVDECLKVARELESGAVHLNGMTIHDQHGLPHGGWKASGWGRFNGRGAIESFTQTKNITLLEPHLLPLSAL